MAVFDRLRSLLHPGPRWEDGRPVVTVVVDDRTMLLGLDHLYREAIKPHERGELLRSARAVAARLAVAPADVPVEGYYNEHQDLTAYFLLMRALQQVDRKRTPEVDRLPEFRRLLEVASSPLFGRPLFLRRGTEYLLPLGRDPLGDALEGTDDWRVPVLIKAARRNARDSDDCSLVALAALAADPVVLAALRESVVLYADWELEMSALPPKEVFVWKVDPELEARARRFVAAFNALFGRLTPLPVPGEANAKAFAAACRDNDIEGRCVRLGQSTDDPPRYYHWAVKRVPGGALAVDEFWDETVWTTERYRRGRPPAADYRPKWRQTFAGQDPDPGPRRTP